MKIQQPLSKQTLMK